MKVPELLQLLDEIEETLNDFRIAYLFRSYLPNKQFQILKENIRKLEILDILKEYFQTTESGQWYIDLQESDFDYRYECTKEEWDKSPQKKIKEWLKDETRKEKNI